MRARAARFWARSPALAASVRAWVRSPGGALFAALNANGLWVIAAALVGGAAWIGMPVRANAARVSPDKGRKENVTETFR